MKIYSWNEINEIKDNLSSFSGTGVSVGSFDGFHQGHRLLIKGLVEKCRANNFCSVVITFTRPLPSIKSGKAYAGDICTLNQKLKLLEEMGIDIVIIAEFTSGFASASGSEFLSGLINNLNMKFITEGVDFRCGYKGADGKEEITAFCRQNKIEYSFLEPVFYSENGKKVRISSSIVRDLISCGKLKPACDLLNRNYFVEITKVMADSAVEQDEMLLLDRNMILQVLPPVGEYKVYILHDRNEKKLISIEITSEFIKFEKNAINVEKNFSICFAC